MSDPLWPHELQLTRLLCPSLSPRVSNFVVSLNNFNLQELLYINSSNFVAFLTNCDGHSWLFVFCMNLEISLSFSPKEKLKGIFIELRFKNLRGDKEIWGWWTLTILSFQSHWHNTSLCSVRSWISLRDFAHLLLGFLLGILFCESVLAMNSLCVVFIFYVFKFWCHLRH